MEELKNNKLTYQDMIDIGYPRYWVDLSLRIAKNMMLKARRQRQKQFTTYTEISDFTKEQADKLLEQTNAKNK